MNPQFEKISAFCRECDQDAMKPGEGAVIILAMDKKDMTDQNRTKSFVQGTRGDLIELLFFAALNSDDIRSMIIEAMKVHLLHDLLGDVKKPESGDAKTEEKAEA